MNIRVFLVLLAAVTLMAVLLVFPPWKVYGEYTGHLRIDRVLGLEFDTTRFFIEQGLIALTAIILAIKFWNKKHG